MCPSCFSSVCPNVRDSSDSDGILLLRYFEPEFVIHWSKIKKSCSQYLAFLVIQKRDFFTSENNWQAGDSFNLNVTEISYVSFSEPFTITFHQSDKKREFQFDVSNFTPIVFLIESLLKNGIAVPSLLRNPFSFSSPQKEYYLEFFPSFNIGTFIHPPPHIFLEVDQFKSIEHLFSQIQKFSSQLFEYLDQSSTLPKDPQFPLSSAASSNHLWIMQSIFREIHEETIERITSLDDLFDESGKLTDPDDFFKRAYYSGIDENLLPETLPFIFGVFNKNSTRFEREEQLEQKSKDFLTLNDQVYSYDAFQISNNKKLNGAFRVIEQDVSRTDRNSPAFFNSDGTGLRILTKLLRCYCVFNPHISYLQGMNDLFVPIILAFFPNWNSESEPVEGDVVVNPDSKLSLIFWCFEAMLRRTNQIDFLANVTDQCQKVSASVLQLVTKISPVAAIWMKKHNLGELLWFYSDFVLLYKRSFGKDIWTAWFQMNCSTCPPNWLIYFSAAIILSVFSELTLLQDVAITTVMDQFPKMMKELDYTKVGYLAEWIYSHHQNQSLLLNRAPSATHGSTFSLYQPPK